jgi:hypothetical protein
MQWEQTRFVSTMLYNVNTSKKQHLIKPHELFSLPQDKIHKKRKDAPKSTREQYEAFLDKANSAKFKKS